MQSDKRLHACVLTVLQGEVSDEDVTPESGLKEVVRVVLTSVLSDLAVCMQVTTSLCQ